MEMLALNVAVKFVMIQDTWSVAVPFLMIISCHLNQVCKLVTRVKIALDPQFLPIILNQDYWGIVDRTDKIILTHANNC